MSDRLPKLFEPCLTPRERAVLEHHLLDWDHATLTTFAIEIKGGTTTTYQNYSSSALTEFIKCQLNQLAMERYLLCADLNPADGLPSPEKVFGHKLPPIEPPAPVAPAQRPRSRSKHKPRPRGSVDCAMMPLMPDKCVTCPFRSEGYDQVRENVQARSLQGINQTCHHTGSIHGKRDTHLCRGARDFQLQIFTGMGVIDEPTDEAWDRARAKYLELPPTPGKRKNREPGTSGSKEDSP